MTIDEAINELNEMRTDPWAINQQIEALDMAIKALEQEPKTDVLDKIRAEIERLHYHPKLDFIKNDEVVDMVLDIIDKYRKGGE